ncbi:MAG: cytochrome c oxidase subunit [Labilithrix sp.]|nr:cytochrome c oxidase subunit [Labilithrix sp.]
MLEVKSWAGALFLIASIGQVAAWAGVMIGSPLAGATLYPLVLATLATPLLPSRSSTRPLLLSATLAYLVARTGVRFFGFTPLVLVELIAGVVLGVATLRSAGREPTAWLRWVRRIEGALFGEAVLLTAFLGVVGSDVHLNDTLFPVGATHLEALVLLFASFRVLMPAGHTRWGWTGLSLTALGAHVFCWGFVVLGSQGMPRRYVQYLGRFSALHTVTSLGAFVFCAGALLLGVAYLASRTRPARAQ